jgi:cell division protein FtsX
MKKSTFVSAGVASFFAVLLAGCGLADVGASAATQGASAAEQVKQGKEIEAMVEKQVEDAQKAAREARDQAEAASN